MLPVVLACHRSAQARPAVFAYSQIFPTFHTTRGVRQVTQRPVLGAIAFRNSRARSGGGASVWSRFLGGIGGLLALYGSVFAALAAHGAQRLGDIEDESSRTSCKEAGATPAERDSRSPAILRSQRRTIKAGPPRRRRAPSNEWLCSSRRGRVRPSRKPNHSRLHRPPTAWRSADPETVDMLARARAGNRYSNLHVAANLALRSPAQPAADGSRSRVVEIDFARLAARGVLTPDAPQSPLANTLRMIKRPLLNNCLGKSASRVQNATRILITSALPAEGKSFVSLNLAMSIAMERDSTVLLVEADPTRPSLSTLMGIPAGRGLMDLLAEPRSNVADVLIKTNVPRLSFIPAGTRHEHATELLASAAMEALVDHLAARYADRVLIFDSGPLLATPEASVLARHMGQIVLVIEAEKTTHASVQQALARVESCPVVMTLLNKAARSYETSDYYEG